MGYRVGGPWGSAAPPVKKVEVETVKDERLLAPKVKKIDGFWGQFERYTDMKQKSTVTMTWFRHFTLSWHERVCRLEWETFLSCQPIFSPQALWRPTAEISVWQSPEPNSLSTHLLRSVQSQIHPSLWGKHRLWGRRLPHQWIHWTHWPSQCLALWAAFRLPAKA